MEEITGRISTLEGKVSEHDRIFDIIREEIRGDGGDGYKAKWKDMDSNFK